MLNIPEEIKELYKQDSISKNFRVHFVNGEYRDLVNADFVSESVIFTESVSSSSKLKFGDADKSSIEFKMYFNNNIKNTYIYCCNEIDISSLSTELISEYGKTSDDVPYPYYSVPYGYFLVTSCKVSNSGIWSVVAYQVMHTITNLPEIEAIKLLEPISLRRWTNGTHSYHKNHKYAFKVNREKLLCEIMGSCNMDYTELVNTYDSNSSILQNMQTLKVANCPKNGLRNWRLSRTYSDSIDSGLDDYYTIVVNGINIHFDSTYHASYQHNSIGVSKGASCGVPISSTLQMEEQEKLPSKDYIYNIAWKNSLDSQITKDALDSNKQELFDLLGKEFFTDLTKPFIKVEFCPPKDWSIAQAHFTYSSMTDPLDNCYIGCEFATSPSGFSSDLNTLNLGSYDYGINYLRSNFAQWQSNYHSLTQSNEFNLFDTNGFSIESGHTSVAIDTREVTDYDGNSIRTYNFGDGIGKEYLPGEYALYSSGRNRYEYVNSVGKSLTHAQMIRNINATKVGNKDTITINPCVRIFNKTTSEEYCSGEYEYAAIGKTFAPHISLSIPTEMIIIKGRDVNLDTDTAFDMCSQSPEGTYDVQVIKFNSFDESELKKYFLDETTNPNDLMFDTQIAVSDVDESVQDIYNGVVPSKETRYLISYGNYSPSIYDYTDNLNFLCIRCTRPDVSKFLSQNQNATSSDIAELQASFIRAKRDSFDEIVLRHLSPESNALYPSNSLYPSENLYPKPSDVAHILRSMWYTFSIDTQENMPYTKVRCVRKVADVDVVYESVVVDNDEENVYDLSSNNYLSAIPIEEITFTLDSIAEALRAIYSNLATIKMKGLPYIEAGDYIVVYTKDGAILICVLRHRITGIQSLIDTIDVV